MKRKKKSLVSLMSILLIFQSLINPFGDMTFATDEESIKVHFNKSSTELYYDDEESMNESNIVNDNPVEVIIVSDYVGDNKLQLESEIAALKETAKEKNITMISHYLDMWDEGNHVVLGQSLEPTFEYYRAAHISMEFDVYENSNISIGSHVTKPGILNISDVFEKVVMTESEELLLNKYPSSYASIIDTGYDQKFNRDNSGWYDVQLYGFQYEVFDNPNISKFKKTVPTFTLVDNGSSHCYGYHDEYDQERARMNHVDITVDKTYTKGAQVSSKLTDIMGFNFSKIKDLSLNSNSDKYLVIMTNRNNTTKSLTDDYIDYFKSVGFKVRYSIPKDASDSKLGNPIIEDVTKDNNSLILKSRDGKYFRIGNSNTPNTITYPIDITSSIKEDTKDLFNNKYKFKISYGDSTANTSYNGSTYRDYYLYKSGYDINGYYSLCSVSFNDGKLYIDNQLILEDVKLIRRAFNFIGVEMNNGNAKLVYPSSVSNVMVIGGMRYQTVGTNMFVLDMPFNTFKVLKRSYQSTPYTFADLTGSISGSFYSENLLVIGDNNNLQLFTSNPHISYKGYNGSYGTYYYFNLHNLRYLNMDNVSAYYENGNNYIRNNILYENGVECINNVTSGYLDDKFTIYIKNGRAFGKGNSSNGELGIVNQNVEDYIEIFHSTDIIAEEYSDKNFISINELSKEVNCLGLDDSTSCIATIGYEIAPENEVISTVFNFIETATQNIDITISDIDNPRIVEALINKAASGIKVRVIADSKRPTIKDDMDIYAIMRNYLESMRRGKDGIVGTTDDIMIFSDSPIFTVKPVNDLPYIDATIGKNNLCGNLIANGELITTNTYYSPDSEMNHKFIIVDDYKILSGSANYTSRDNVNTQNMIEINSVEIAKAYKFEFEQMWGSNTTTPDPLNSNFGLRKQSYEKTSFLVGNKPVEIYFGPKSKIIDKVTEIVAGEADKSLYFSISSWSYNPLIDAARNKYDHNDPNKVLIDIKGTFDSNSLNQSLSASKKMLGTSTVAEDNWTKHPSVYASKEDGELNSKYMILDVNSDSNPTVITGSTNWNDISNTSSDENLIVIRDGAIAKQYFNDFASIYKRAGGEIDSTINSWTKAGSLKSPRAYFDVIVQDNKIWSYFGLKENNFQTDYTSNGTSYSWTVPSTLYEYNTTIESYDINTGLTEVFNTNSSNLYGFNIYKNPESEKFNTFSGLNINNQYKSYELNGSTYTTIEDSANSPYMGYNMKTFNYEGNPVIQGVKGADEVNKTKGYIVDQSGTYDFPDTRSSFDCSIYDGKLYFVGGLNYDSATNKTEYFTPIAFDLKTKAFESFGDKKIERSGGKTFVHRGMLFYIGGSKINSNNEFEASTDIDIFDFDTGKWYVGPKVNKARNNNAVAQLNDKLYVLGGIDDSIVNEIECYDSYKNEYTDKSLITSSINYIVKEEKLYIKCISDVKNTWITIGGYDNDKVYNLEMKNGNFIELPLLSDVNSISISPYVTKYNSIDFYGKINLDISNSKLYIDREKSVISGSSFDLVVSGNKDGITKLQLYNNNILLYEGLNKTLHLDLANGNNSIVLKAVFPNGDAIVVDNYPIYNYLYVPDFQEKEYNYIYNDDNTLKEIRDSNGSILVEFIYDDNGNLIKSLKHKGAN